ncbi:hypothetical protein GQ57_02415 [Burkholderia sp. MSh2]|uniref:Glycosyltransferase RgtA/B/C/D-like domain-containing protein n=1 Tax=Burkholderia paludis TaxID=1506587 RepID=A0A6J5DP42_9BURK|nr:MULTISPECIES: hypothetical protein [Burkholderia]KEZ07461.1 hypothetical protein GQ57_02415 [Burkholderia sp. MSh2]CAB3756019.1 hypothetical protein LMG30113_02570 [Burkholderia paludis]VWB59940.1 hypothetical protein BPA30113_02646 [Burkholderia paludis]
MLHKLTEAGPALSRGLRSAIATLAVLLYWIVYAKAGAFLPEYVFRDADKIQSQIGGSGDYDGTSFDAVAKFYAMLGASGTHVLTAAIGALCIWMTIAHARRVGSLVASLVLLAPCVFFNLFVASKDTLVVLMAIVLARVAQRRSVFVTVTAAVVLYGGYAAVVRGYFALILAIALAALLFRRGSWGRRTWLMLAALLALFLLPNDIYYLLQHPRDMAADYLAHGSPFGARTSFHNLVAPDSFGAFCMNYLYALSRLNLPVLFSPGPKEIAMQVFVWIALAAVWRRARHDTKPARDVLAALVVGHIAVSMLFEPDLGSYTRHLSSAALLCAVQFATVSRPARRPGRRPDAPGIAVVNAPAAVPGTPPARRHDRPSRGRHA